MKIKTMSLAIAAAIGIAGCASTKLMVEEARQFEVVPLQSFQTKVIFEKNYDGIKNDLLTGGQGISGLKKPAAPAYADPKFPDAAELRVAAIHANFRALTDSTPNGGFGTLYGPNIDISGKPTLGEGLVAGDEFITYADDGLGKQNVTLMVQVPAKFDPKNPCIVSASSSGSRGIYGAIGTAGEWGLKHNCAVAYTDKGTGTGAHDVQNDIVNLIDGERVSTLRAGVQSNFTAPMNVVQQAKFKQETPNRFAFKHTHSKQNPEKDWGKNTLDAIEFAFYVLNQKITDGRAGKYTPRNTIVIASSISNGAAAALRGAEQDTKGLISGIAVSEPQVFPALAQPVTITQGGKTISTQGRSLLDYYTLQNLYQPCANLAADNKTAPFNLTPPSLMQGRCDSLKEKGLLKSSTPAEQAAEAQKIINDYGFLPEQNPVAPSHYAFNIHQSIVVTYANSYGRFGVEDNLCGFSFGATVAAGKDVDPLTIGNLRPATGTEAIFATSSGIPPTGGVNLIYNLAQGGPREDRYAVSPSTGRADLNIDGAICLRNLATGVDAITGAPLTGDDLTKYQRIAQGINEIKVTGNLRGKPTIIVNGRADGVVSPNFSSRSYFAANQRAEGTASKLKYIEVANAQHLDAFNGFAGFDSRFVPLHVYFTGALDAMWNHLKNGAPLPASQVVRAVPRQVVSGKAVELNTSNLPAIAATAGNDAAISFDGNTLRIPD
ncbi:MAG: 3-hydroxybutyrate oligomer hydrolase family protein [Burkholderiales bacterium]